MNTNLSTVRTVEQRWIWRNEKWGYGKKDKNGKDAYRICGYYGTVAACIRGCFKEKCLELAAGEDMELKEAAAEFERIEKRLESVMPDVFKR